MIQNEKKKINEQKQTYEDTDDGIDKHIKLLYLYAMCIRNQKKDYAC